MTKALQYDGATTHAENILDVGDGVLEVGTGDCAIFVWFVSETASGASLQTVVRLDRTSTFNDAFGLTLYIGNSSNSNKLRGDISDSATPVTLISLLGDTANIGGDNKRHSAILSRKAGNAFLYLDGVVQADTKASLHDFNFSGQGKARHSFTNGGTVTNAVVTNRFDGPISRSGYIAGTVNDAEAVLIHNNGIPLSSSAISNIVLGYDIDDIVSLPNVPNSVGISVEKMITVGLVAGDIVDLPDLPPPTNFDIVDFTSQIQQTKSIDGQIQRTFSVDGQIDQTKDFTVER